MERQASVSTTWRCTLSWVNKTEGKNNKLKLMQKNEKKKKWWDFQVGRRKIPKCIKMTEKHQYTTINSGRVCRKIYVDMRDDVRWLGNTATDDGGYVQSIGHQKCKEKRRETERWDWRRYFSLLWQFNVLLSYQKPTGHRHL